jgi:hypothetical protein
MLLWRIVCPLVARACVARANVAWACVVGLRGALRSTAPARERFLLEHFSIKRMPGLDPGGIACPAAGLSARTPI